MKCQLLNLCLYYSHSMFIASTEEREFWWSLYWCWRSNYQVNTSWFGTRVVFVTNQCSSLLSLSSHAISHSVTKISRSCFPARTFLETCLTSLSIFRSKTASSIAYPWYIRARWTGSLSWVMSTAPRTNIMVTSSILGPILPRKSNVRQRKRRPWYAPQKSSSRSSPHNPYLWEAYTRWPSVAQRILLHNDTNPCRLWNNKLHQFQDQGSESGRATSHLYREGDKICYEGMEAEK